jgi:hypothetical protein
MPLTELNRKKFTQWWIAIFYGLAIFKWSQGLWLYQFEPFLFSTRFDGISWLIMETGIHLRLLNNKAFLVIADLLFYGCPLLYLVVFHLKPLYAARFAWFWLLVNFFYVEVYTLFPTNSIEAHTAWLLFPVLFAMRSLKSFYLIMNGLRYFFLFFFFSAGIWKIVNGGVFEPSVMSAILMEQHKEYLVSSGNYWQAKMIYFLIGLPLLSYALYWIGTLIELSFLIGLISKRFDKLLIVGFLAFLVFDFLIMRIPYVEVTPFLLTMIYGNYKLPINE